MKKVFFRFTIIIIFLLLIGFVVYLGLIVWSFYSSNEQAKANTGSCPGVEVSLVSYQCRNGAVSLTLRNTGEQDIKDLLVFLTDKDSRDVYNPRTGFGTGIGGLKVGEEKESILSVLSTDRFVRIVPYDISGRLCLLNSVSRDFSCTE